VRLLDHGVAAVLSGLAGTVRTDVVRSSNDLTLDQR
jgi:hypothetical protein